jgi:tRNA(fMet)-specific endonuclease VapC
MILLDTDTFTLLGDKHPKVTARLAAVTDTVAITIVTRVEALEGRIAFLMKAADGDQLLRAQQWLQRTESDLAKLTVIPFDAAAAAQFFALLGTKGLKRVDRGDLMIASIALANKATLVTRNLKDYRKIPAFNWTTGLIDSTTSSPSLKPSTHHPTGVVMPATMSLPTLLATGGLPACPR